jgi:hypothetical protein
VVRLLCAHLVEFSEDALLRRESGQSRFALLRRLALLWLKGLLRLRSTAKFFVLAPKTVALGERGGNPAVATPSRLRFWLWLGFVVIGRHIDVKIFVARLVVARVIEIVVGLIVGIVVLFKIEIVI